MSVTPCILIESYNVSDEPTTSIIYVE